MEGRGLGPVFNRGRRAAGSQRRNAVVGPGGQPVPESGYSARQTQLQVVPFAPLAGANVQGGGYAYPPSTQIPSIYPGPQLFCGVEAINRNWMVLTAADVPYFQQSQQVNFPDVTTRDGGRPGAQLGPGIFARVFGPKRQAHSAAAADLQAGLLGVQSPIPVN